MPSPLSSRSAVRRKATLLGVLLGLVLGGWALTAQAFLSLAAIPGFYVPQVYYKFGAVYTRTIVPGPNGRPVYVEYDISGKEAREIGEATGKFERAKVMPGDSYRALLKRKDDTRARYPTSEVMTAAAYRGKTFKTVTGETITKPGLDDGVLTVLVRPDKELFTTDGKELVLLQLTIKDGVTPDAASKSLLLSPEGDILAQTANTIGFRVGFFGKDGKVSDTLVRDRDAKIYGPMAGVGVSLGSHVLGGYGMTDSTGKYTMNYFLPACPGFFFEYTTPAYLELYYKRFNPRGGSHMVYYMTKPDYDTCNGMGVWSLAAAMIVATSATPVKRAMDFPVDLMVIDGTATVKNAKVSDSTAYSAETSDRERYLQEKYDFDGDEKPEFVVPGKKVTKTVDGKPKEVFVTTSVKEAELQGIYLSSRYDSAPTNTEETAPDFTRLIDTAPDFNDRGLLDSITKEDLKDTDIYVFRESNGQLVAERRGLHEDELYKSYSGVDEAKEAFRFSIQLRGSVENYYAIAGRTGEANFAKWQSAGGFKEEFQKRTANHLKAGEQVRIIAINRPTGYVGSKTFQLQSSLSGNIINVNSQLIQMGPPNLKIWAERKSKIEAGMTKGDQKKQLIGNEGAGLGSDISIAIYTDWRDADGSPLPEELADYGYTGRLAKIVAANQLAPVGANSLSQFKIKPGQQVQVIQLPEKVLAKQHLYLQVAGQPENRNPSFKSDGSASGVLKYRPTHYVPVQVPLHEEEASELARQAYRKAKKQSPDLNLKAPEPMYEWRYRSEMQFSLYDLNVQSIRRKDSLDNIENVKNNKAPTFASSDKLIGMIYDLLQSSIPGLESWDRASEREMVIAFGEEEIKAKIGESQEIKFENIEHLSALSADDYLSIRLYANNDTANVLYEFAFDYVVLDTKKVELRKMDEEYFEVSADTPEIGMQGWLIGYKNRPSKAPKPNTYWAVEGAGYLDTPGMLAGNQIGYFENKLTLPRTAGSVATVTMKEVDSNTEARFGKLKVVPGAITTITVNSSGKSHVFAKGETALTARLQDRYGNNAADGTPVEWSIGGNATLLKVDTETTNGIAKAVLVGGGEAGDANVTVRSGSAEKVSQTKILPFNIALSAPAQVSGGETFQISLTVTDSDGAAVADAFYQPNSNLGRIDVKNTATGADGRATFSVRADKKDQQGNVGVRIGAQVKQAAVLVEMPTGSVSVASNSILVGDSPVKGVVQANWFEAVNVDVPFEVEQQLSIRGRANETVQLKLGSGGILNIAPLLTYPLTGVLEGDVVMEANGRDSALASYVNMVKDSPFDAGNSLEFQKENRREDKGVVTFVSSTVTAPLPEALKTAEATEFKIDLKFKEGSGTVLALGNGQKLELDSSGHLKLTVHTGAGESTVTSSVLQVETWYNVIARYDGNSINLVVNSKNGLSEVSNRSAALRGVVDYGSSAEIFIGGGFAGRLRGLELYDLNAPALVTFSGGGDTAQITLDNQGEGAIGVRSTGALLGLVAPEARENFIRKIPLEMHRSTQAGLIDLDYVTLVTKNSFQGILEAFTSTTPLPPEAIAALSAPNRYQPYWLPSNIHILPAAYAGWSDWLPSVEQIKEIGTKGLEIAGEAVKWVVPYDDAITIAQQLEYLYNGSKEYNPMLLAASSLSVLSIFPLPFTKALKVVMKPVKALAQIVGRGKFGIAFGKKFLQLASDCVDGRGKGAACQTLQAVMPFVETVGYMYLTDKEAFEQMLTSLESEEDFLVIFDFALMGIDLEWLGLSPEETPAEFTITANNSLGLRVAYAADSSDVLKKFGRGFIGVFKKLKKEEVISENVTIFKILRPLTKLRPWFAEKDRKEVLKNVVNVKFMKMIGVAASRNVSGVIVGIIKGYSGQRLPQPVVWGMLYYLLVDQRDYFKKKNVEEKIWVKVGLAFFDIGSINNAPAVCPIDPATDPKVVEVNKGSGKVISRLSQANGALYHLSQIATMRLAGEEIVGVEVPHTVKLYSQLPGFPKVSSGEFQRDTDIVSGSDGKLLVETKSLSAIKGNDLVWKSYYFSAWTNKNGEKTSLMRQFLLDQVEAQTAPPKTRIRWYFDTFKNKSSTKCGTPTGGFYSDAEMNKAREVMRKAPGWFVTGGYVEPSIGYATAKFESVYSADLMDDIVLNEGFLDKAFKILIAKGHSFVKEEDVERILAQLL